jgi:hypothetical protein
MSHEPTDVLIGAYLATGPAKLDYQSVIDSKAKIEGAVCVSRDHAGEMHVEQTDHMARKGAEVLGDRAGYHLGRPHLSRSCA